MGCPTWGVCKRRKCLKVLNEGDRCQKGYGPAAWRPSGPKCCSGLYCCSHCGTCKERIKPQCSAKGHKCCAIRKCCANLICNTDAGYGVKNICIDIPREPKCSQKGNECNYGQKCCGDNLICSGEGYGGKMVCKDRTQTTPKPKCSQKGGECNYG